MARSRNHGALAAARALAVVAACWRPCGGQDLVAAAETASDAGVLAAERLRCEYRTEPLGVDRPRPELSWIVTSPERAQEQSAYRVLVASSPEQLAANVGDLWDTGRVESDATFGIRYDGRPLASHQSCYWKVRTWDAAGRPGRWSKPARWTVGLLDPQEWTGQWIGSDANGTVGGKADFGAAKWIWHDADPEQPPRQPRVFIGQWDLPSDGSLTSATLTVAADDRCVVHVNGVQVAFTRELGLPMQVDVRSHLRPGANEVRVEASNGPGGPAGLLLHIAAKTAGGEKLSFVTNDQWRSAEVAAEDWRTMDLDSAAPVRVLAPAGSQPWGPLELTAYATTPPAYLRSGFAADQTVRRATAYLAALGWADLYLNGQLVNQDYFSSGWTDYRKRVYYRAYDVTDALRDGENVLGIVLADGWYSGRIGWGGASHLYGSRPRVRMMLRLEYEDGSVETVSTDETWAAVAGPTTVADILIGEEYDASSSRVDWNQADAEPSRGLAVETGAEVSPLIQWHPGPKVVEVGEFRAEEVTEPAPGVYVFDLGQNIAGVPRLKIHGRPGQQIQLRFAERLNEDGTLYTTNLRYARAIDRYTCRGGGEEIWQPRQTFHGFQYVELTGLDEKPPVDAVIGVALSSDTPLASEFECSDPMLNRLYQNVLWTQRANFIDVPTDCPQRDERLGWTGDAQVYVNTAAMVCDVQAFFRKWLIDLTDAQREDGQFPKVAPVVLGLDDGGPAWADAGVICPWTIYEVYGDRELLARQYPSMMQFLEFCRKRSKDGVLPPEQFHAYGDWLSINADTPKEVIYTAYLANAARICSLAAAELGKEDDAKLCDQYYQAIKEAFNREYVTDEGVVRGDTQCGYVLALAFDLVDGERAKQAAERLVADIEERGWHLSTGFIGTKDLMLVLSKIGRVDIAFKLLHQDTFPGWGFSIKHGATSIWERWDGWTPERGFQDVGMNSFAHYSFGAVYGWMVENLGGIRRGDPAFKFVTIKPQIDPALDHCRVKYDSIRGPFETEWRRDGAQIELRCVVPANATAAIKLERTDEVTVVGVDGGAERDSGITGIVAYPYPGERNRLPIWSAVVPSGEYRFRYSAPAAP